MEEPHQQERSGKPQDDIPDHAVGVSVEIPELSEKRLPHQPVMHREPDDGDGQHREEQLLPAKRVRTGDEEDLLPAPFKLADIVDRRPLVLKPALRNIRRLDLVHGAEVGKDLDAMVAEDEDLAAVAKSVTVDVVARTLMTSTNHEPMTQFSESGMGYSASGSFLVPGGGLFIKKSELARLGLRRQRFGVMEIYGIPEGN